MTYWTKERVRNGLARFVRDYFEGRESELPPRAHNYRHSIPPEDARMAKRLRLYPEYTSVLRYYPSIIAAWADLGYEVQSTGREYWTHEKVVEGLKVFVADKGCAPTDQGIYHSLAKLTPKYNKSGFPAPRGAYNKYPSWPCVRKFFRTMRAAWEAAGVDVDHGFEPWSDTEDWFILESVGILPRTEVAPYIRRTEAAVKRRLYDLGRINSKNRWGITANAAANQLELGNAVIHRYLDRGHIPFFRGYKSIYINPADLLTITEFDWTTLPEDSRLATLIKKSLIQRALKILKYGPAWRDHELYRAVQTKRLLGGRIKKHRKPALPEVLPPAPNDLKAGDWIRLNQRIRMVDVDRLGVIKGIFYSPMKHPRPDGSKRCAWMANVEFPKIRKILPETATRVRYNLPLDCLRRAEAPVIPIELSENPEAVRGRLRFKERIARSADRLARVRQELT